MHLLLEALYLFSFFFWAPISPSVHQIWLSWCALLPYTPLTEQMRQMQSTLRLGEDWAHRKCQEWQLLASYPLLNFPSLFPKTSEEPLFNPVYLNTLSTPHPPTPSPPLLNPPHPHPAWRLPCWAQRWKAVSATKSLQALSYSSWLGPFPFSLCHWYGYYLSISMWQMNPKGSEWLNAFIVSQFL